jgi:hypothetical protein
LAIVFFTIAGLGFISTGVLMKEFRANYVMMFSGRTLNNLLVENITDYAREKLALIAPSKLEGLPIVSVKVNPMHLSEYGKKGPDSLKDWVPAVINIDNVDAQDARLRIHGGSPENWKHREQSYKLKRKGKIFSNGYDVFKLKRIQEQDFIRGMLSTTLSKELGVLTPEKRLVELVLNETPIGVYEETEFIGEGFLRRNNKMPVDIFKGELVNEERTYLTEPDLFNSPFLWSKSATFNSIQKRDYRSLENFLETLKSAELNHQFITNLKKIAPFEAWVGAAAHSTLNISASNNDYHNMRLLYDYWTGTVSPISVDAAGRWGSGDVLPLDYGSHKLLRLYNRLPDFLFLKHKKLYEFVSSGRLSKIAEKQSKELPNIYATVYRGGGVLNRHSIETTYPENISMEERHQLVLDAMKGFEKELLVKLRLEPEVHWSSIPGGVEISIMNHLPVGVVEMEGNFAPDTDIFFDIDGDGKISDSDQRLDYNWLADRLVLDGVFYANRNFKGEHVPTSFRLIFSKPVSVDKITVSNVLTGVQRLAAKTNKPSGLSPTNLNRVVQQDKPPKNTVLSGQLTFDKDVEFDSPVEIREGTVIKLGPGTSLIFRDKVYIRGTSRNPVLFQRLDPNRPWGSVSIVGPKTAKTKWQHAIFEGGSGGRVGNIFFSGMVNVHHTSFIEFENITISQNLYFDDMLHFVYVKGFKLKNIALSGARKDAFDVDISSGVISGFHSRGAGNDALDFMTSEVEIVDANLIGSGDKGISVGEQTRLTVNNVTFSGNKIGIEVKDASTVRVLGSKFSGNAIAVAASSKNWRYGAGGKAEIEASLFLDGMQIFKADENSEVKLKNIAIPSTEFRTIGNVLLE